MVKCFIALFMGPFLFLQIGHATSFYTSPTAALNGDGSQANPWTLRTALEHPAALQPGDTVWLAGGIYMDAVDAQTSFRCLTNGLPDAPILFRNIPGGRAILDGNLQYTLYLGFGQCSYTWFWGIEVTNSFSTDRDHNIPGGITCTAEHIKFINMIVHDTGTGIDTWKSARNTEVYGCIIYHIGNNLNNNGNKEGHGHGMYLQNDTVGTRWIHDNIIFNTYGYGIHLWQTTTTSAIGNFDIRRNIIFNGGAASENMGGPGNNSRTHNFFVVANGSGNPVENTVIKHNFTWASPEMPRPSVNAFGLNQGVRNMVLDSNILTCQTRLGYTNTPIFEASVKGNRIISGIPDIYGYYLWGFAMPDFPENEYFPVIPASGNDVYILPNKYEPGRAHIAIYNWGLASEVDIDISPAGLKQGDQYELRQALDLEEIILTGTYNGDDILTVPMSGYSMVKPTGSDQEPLSTFPSFGVFVLQKTKGEGPSSVHDLHSALNLTIMPNPTTGYCTLTSSLPISCEIFVTDLMGRPVHHSALDLSDQEKTLDLSHLSKGMYLIHLTGESTHLTRQLVIQ
ncbi:MAG: T9SS type A sorting domain-containing protein [Saprospiraceae bacterium]|nr:T9SS type A sorting domain-containing protein [Saprospiraceae bacterium]